MQLLALAIAPGLAICLFIFHRDAYNKEPKRNLLFSFFLGACSIITAIIIEGLFKNIPSKTISGTAVSAFLVVALTEELGKFIVLRYYAYTRKSFDEPLDGIVYGVMISMGFATLENVLYVIKYAELGQGYQIAFLRMFTAVPAHATFGVLMGYYVGKAKFDGVNKNRLLLTGLFWAVLFHGAYDYCLFLQGLPAVKEYISDGFLFAGALISFIIAIRLSLKHIKMHRRLSQKTFRPTETMALRKAFPHDIPLIRDMAFKIWPVTYGGILTNDQLDYMLGLLYSEKRLEEDMQKGIQFAMLYDGVQPIGFASIGMTEPQIYKLHKIYVLPSYQGKGAGKFIINELINVIKQKGATTLLLNVNRNNPAISFYEKLGFTVIREEDVDIGNGYFMNDYVMEKKVGA
jgi:RsiW-degrading membrane proteinase PrsW (M82 family)/ribosomal protein S18 acetylase RimI-like enzyme